MVVQVKCQGQKCHQKFNHV